MSERDQIVTLIMDRSAKQMARADLWPNPRESHWFWRATALQSIAAEIRNGRHELPENAGDPPEAYRGAP